MDEWKLIAMKLFSSWRDRPFDGETVESIEFFIKIAYFGVISISFHSVSDVLQLQNDSVALFTWNQICFHDMLTCQWKFSVWVKWCFCVLERRKKIHYYECPVVFFRPDSDFFELKYRWQADFLIGNKFFNPLIFRPIRSRENKNKNKS